MLSECALQSFQHYQSGRVITFRLLSRLGGLSGAGALPADEAAAVAEECAAAGLFWEALAKGGRQAAVDSPAVSFSLVATAASGRRLQLTFRRRGRQLLPLKVLELPAGPDGDAEAAAKYLAWQQQQQELQEQFQTQQQQAEEARQAERQAEAAARPSAPLPPPPFGPAGAAMLLTGLARMELRVPGVVEPLLHQCEPAMPAATANDVARILIALGELRMDIGAPAWLPSRSPGCSAVHHCAALLAITCRPHAGLSAFAPADSSLPRPASASHAVCPPAAVELHAALCSRLDAVCRELAPQQMAGALWACTRTSSHVPRIAGIGIRHLSARLADYSAGDAICVLWACTHMGATIPGEQQAGGRVGCCRWDAMQ